MKTQDDRRHELMTTVREELLGPAWQKTPPTVPGWYWAAKYGFGLEPYMVKVVIFDDENDIWVKWDEDSHLHHLDFFDHWLGPLPVPEPPHG